MEKLSIQDASYRLNLSQAAIRDCIRNGELKASREAGPEGRRWMVEIPEAGWVDSFRASLNSMSATITPWWWPTAEMRGAVHYVEDMGIEEIEPLYLCGLKGANVWDAKNHTVEDRCPKCSDIAKERELPLWD